MSTPQSVPVARQHSPLMFILFPAIAMLLGWGLRGYIGGGPYGALIPGTFVTLAICLLLGFKMETAAIAALFGAIGIGYGGNETYGQTLGFLKNKDTIYWGVEGCLLKGGVWGLLGGAVLGLGIDRTVCSRKTVALAILVTIPAFYIGLTLINEPKLIYFSNRLDKPRDESWAGLLFAAIALLSYLRLCGPRGAVTMPLRFAMWGTLGGALGFGGGCLFLAYGPKEWNWVGWWKMMEFSFGLIFGAALGWCAWLNREQLSRSGQSTNTPPPGLGLCLVYVVFVALVFYGFPTVSEMLPKGFQSEKGLSAWVTRTLFSLVLGYVTFGAVSLILGLNSLHTAWQCAITLTVFHTVLDYTRDLNDVANFGYTLSGQGQFAVLVIASALVGGIASWLMSGRAAVRNLFLLVLWACYFSGLARSFLNKDYLFPEEGKPGLLAILQEHPSLIVVQGIFTASTLWLTWVLLTCFGDDDQGEAVENQKAWAAVE
ncbi:MAG: hypothetical protein U0929_08875 [Planctomycetaceae bacterium]